MKKLNHLLLFAILPFFVHAQQASDKQITDFRKGRYDYGKLYDLEKYAMEKQGGWPLADSIARTLYTGYIKKMNEKRLLNPQTLLFIDTHRHLVSSKDLVFRLAGSDPGKLTALAAIDPSALRLNVIAREEVTDKVWNGDKLLSDAPDWEAYRKALVDKYALQSADSVILFNQFRFYISINQRGLAAKTKTKMVENYPSEAGGFSFYLSLNGWAWDYFLKSDDPEELEEALKWSARSLEIGNSERHMDTYANLLHKLGRSQQAVEYEMKVLETVVQRARSERRPLQTDGDVLEFTECLYKMLKGEPTWPEKK